MNAARGYTLVELLVSLGLVSVLAGISVPVFMSSSNRNEVWTGAERIGTSIRQARLKAISRNAAFRVRFDCPRVGSFRVLAMTGDPLVDDAPDRCDTTRPNDSGESAMPQGVSFGDVPTLEVSGRGIFTAIGGAIPQTIAVSSGDVTRILRVSAAGQIAFRDNLDDEVIDEGQ